MTAQLTLDFTAIASDQEQTYAIAYLEKAYKTYSGSSLADKNRIKGIFHHLGMPYVCVGALHHFGLKEVNLNRLYSPDDWQSNPPEQPTEKGYYWGREAQHKGHTWIMGDRITLKADPHERAIAVAKDKIDWSLDTLDRTIPYATGEKQDPSWGIDWYQRQAEEARSLLLEGIQEAEKLGVLVDRDRIQAVIQKLDKMWEVNS